MENENMDFETAKQLALQNFDEGNETDDEVYGEVPEPQPQEQNVVDEQQQEQGQTAENDTVQQPPTDTEPVSPQEQALQAANIAEQAAQVAQQQNTDLSNLQAQVNQLMEENKNLQNAIDQQNAQQMEHVEDLVAPTLDFDRMMFEDEQTQREIMQNYQNDLANYQREMILRELKPDLDFARTARIDAEKNAIVDELSALPEFQNMRAMMPQINNVMSSNAALFSDDVPLDERLVTAYAMVNGVNNIRTPKEPKAPTAEEIVNMLNSNPEAMELLEKQRIAKLNNAKDVPKMSATSGVSNVAATVHEKPKTFEEALMLSRKAFGID